MKVVQRDWPGNEAWFYLTVVKVKADLYHVEEKVKSSWGEPDDKLKSVETPDEVRAVLEDWLVDDVDGIMAELEA